MGRLVKVLIVLMGSILFWGVFVVVWGSFLLGNMLGDCFDVQVCRDHKADFYQWFWAYLLIPPILALGAYVLGFRALLRRWRDKAAQRPSRSVADHF
jgi:hypothetical protein